MDIANFRKAKLNNKKIIIRVDYNVPMNGKKITDDNRIRATLPTLKTLLKNNCSIIIISHLGRPNGKKDPKLSLKPIAKKLSTILRKKVYFLNDCIGKEVENFCSNLKPKQIVLLENLRFHVEEEKNNRAFAKKIASLGDIYIDDAFGCAHRAHASIEAITNYLPSYAGDLLTREVKNLSTVHKFLRSPVTMIIGGAKIDTKIDLIKNFAGIVDHFIIGGGIANTFLAAKKFNLGKSLVQKNKINTAKSLETMIRRHNKNIHFPYEYIIAKKPAKVIMTSKASGKKIPNDKMILDIGVKSAKHFADIIKKSKTIIWNGPMGVYEFPPFRRGTRIIAKAVVAASNKGANTIVGGGDTIDALKVLHISQKHFAHVSTGGGAMLEFLEKGTLPGIEALKKSTK